MQATGRRAAPSRTPVSSPFCDPTSPLSTSIPEPPPTPTLRAGITAALPLAVAVAAFGASFGVLARAAGFDGVAAIVMSATTFAGSAQLAAVSVLGAGGGAAAAILAAVLLNTRYTPIGLSAASALDGGRFRRVLEAQLIVDESWALAQRGGRLDRRLLLGAGVTLYAGWMVGTVLGVLFGGLVGDPARLGLDAAFPALFAGLLLAQLRTAVARVVALLGAAIALGLTPVLRPGLPLVCACAALLVALRRRTVPR